MVMFASGLLVGILGASGIIYVLAGRQIRRLTLDYDAKSARYAIAISDFEVLIRKSSKILDKEGVKLS